MIGLHPCVADRQSVENHGADGYAPLSHVGKGGYSGGGKVARKLLRILRGIVSRDSAGIGRRYGEQDTTGLYGEDGVSGLGQALQVDVQAAIDLSDARTGGFTVNHQGFV